MVLWHPIPGETPIEDLSGIKVKGIKVRKDLNEVEAKNITKAVEKYLERAPTKKMAPFDFVWALKLHREMFGDVWEWAGTLRQKEVNVGLPVLQIEIALDELMKNLEFWTDMPFIEQAARLHHRAVQIHPFQNGNGRWSRMLANVWLKKNRQPITQWPEKVVGEASPIRANYLTAVKAADQGEFSALLGLHNQFTPQP